MAGSANLKHLRLVEEDSMSFSRYWHILLLICVSMAELLKIRYRVSSARNPVCFSSGLFFLRRLTR